MFHVLAFPVLTFLPCRLGGHRVGDFLPEGGREIGLAEEDLREPGEVHIWVEPFRDGCRVRRPGRSEVVVDDGRDVLVDDRRVERRDASKRHARYADALCVDERQASQECDRLEDVRCHEPPVAASRQRHEARHFPAGSPSRHVPGGNTSAPSGIFRIRPVTLIALLASFESIISFLLTPLLYQNLAGMS